MRKIESVMNLTPFCLSLWFCQTCYFLVQFQSRGPDASKNLVRDIEFIEIILILCDFSDFNGFVKHLKLAISKEKLVQIIFLHYMQANLESNQTFKFITQYQLAQFKHYKCL